MANKKVTDLTELTSAANDDLVYIVDVSDTTGSSSGTGKKITKNNLVGSGGGGGASALNDLSDVTLSSVSLRDILIADSSGNFANSQLFNTIYTLLKLGTSTTLTDGANTNSEMELTGTTAKLKTGITELKLTETSPGDIEFVVATDASGSTAFTAVHLDGLTTANDAQFIIKDGCQLVCEATGGAQGRITYSGAGNAALALPTSSGTIALTSDIASDSAVAANTAKTSFPGFGTSAGTALEGDTALLQLGTTSTTALAGDTTTISASQASAITANTAKNSYPSADASKLSGIETGADVTDATNVAAAGALMAASAQLTGNLDTQANEINTTTSNGNVKVAANGTGLLEVRGNVGGGSDDNPGAIKLNCAQNSHGITIQSPAHSVGASYTLTLPSNDGDADQVLKTDGSGNLSWTAQTGGSGGGIKFATAFGGRWEFSSSETGANKWVQLGGYYGMSFYNWTNSQTATLSADPPTVGTSTLTLSEYLYGKYAWITPAAGTLKIRATCSWDTATSGMAGEIMDWICLKIPSSNLDGTYNGSVAGTVCAYGSVTCPSSSANISPNVISIDGGSVSAGDAIMTLARFEDATFTSTQRLQSNVSFSVE